MVTLSYDKASNTAYIQGAGPKAFIPQYLYYLLEYHNIPTNSVLVFSDSTKKYMIIDKKFKEITTCRH